MKLKEKIKKSSILFKTLGDPTRLRIIQAIAKENKSVGTIAEELDMTHSAISHQLSILKASNIVKNERKGKEQIYSLTDEHIQTIIETVFTHAECH